MLGNLKEFLTVVQDGLASNNNIRQTLHEVQKVTNMFKEKKVVSESKVNYGAGGELLDHYQEEWVKMHENADQNAKAAEEVDRMIIQLHSVTKSHLQSANDLAQNLALIPSLTASVAQCVDTLKTLNVLMKAVEEEVLEFEDKMERKKMENWKLDHQYHLTVYKEKKMLALEEVRNQLANENTQQSVQRERRQLAELQSRREESASAFQQDVAMYMAGGLTPGYPTISSVTLEQIELDTDNDDLEKFLHDDEEANEEKCEDCHTKAVDS